MTAHHAAWSDSSTCQSANNQVTRSSIAHMLVVSCDGRCRKLLLRQTLVCCFNLAKWYGCSAARRHCMLLEWPALLKCLLVPPNLTPALGSYTTCKSFSYPTPDTTVGAAAQTTHMLIHPSIASELAPTHLGQCPHLCLPPASAAVDQAGHHCLWR